MEDRSAGGRIRFDWGLSELERWIEAPGVGSIVCGGA